ncbi:hypothetical protein O181_063741 [Austropuccinia psidii MF-1]|uniref:Integrase catalytic domain-containing protein n=1 Tax=Austropuccinia psidii MF-1 TaxID=1389203 RepID=A0A9Q3EKK4_9BASI|nr:hypothetical protein [Austropuccinia psidii MF-1]
MPEQNPFSEWANRNLLEKARFLLTDSNLPHEWWGEAMATEAYLLNRTPVASVGFKTPHEMYLGQLPKTSHLHVFGCLTFVNKAKANVSGVYETDDNITINQQYYDCAYEI